MRLILDECLPRRLGLALTGHDVTTVARAGLAGVTNGELLRRLAGKIDGFITIDKNLPSQQETAHLSFGVVVLRAPSNRIEHLSPLVPAILAALENLQPGNVAHIKAE